MPINNNPNIDRLANDLQAFLQFSSARGASSSTPAAPAMPEPIGRVNNALLDLRGRRSRLNPTQGATVDAIGEFYNRTASQDLTPTPIKNRDLFAIPAHQLQGLEEREKITLKRNASFLLNAEVFEPLHEEMEKIPYEAGMIGHSTSTLMVNAITNSVKSQIEYNNAAALSEARHGKRICPMTLQPALLHNYLYKQNNLLEQLVNACGSAGSTGLARGRTTGAIASSLQKLAVAYFNASANYPGASVLRPDQVEVKIGATSDCDIELYDRNRIKLTVSLSDNKVAEFCRAPLPQMEDCTDQETLMRSHALQGFGNHSTQKKMAAYYMQTLLQKLSEFQENIGLNDTNNTLPNPSARLQAQQAAKRTLEEVEYQGSKAFGDSITWENGQPSERALATRELKKLWGMDKEFESKYGSKLILSPRVNAWIHSPLSMMDLMSLEKPAQRLQLQVAPLTGRALLETPAFRHPD